MTDPTDVPTSGPQRTSEVDAAPAPTLTLKPGSPPAPTPTLKPGSASAPTQMLAVRNLTVSYGHRPVLRAVSFSVAPGEVLGIIGPNGAGKSTLLKAILGLVAMDSGQVAFAGVAIGRPQGQIAYVPQRGDIDWDFPATALDVVLMGRYRRIGWLRRPQAADRQLARELLARVAMADHADTQIGQMSGGQQQRVFIARALAQASPLLLLDEPFIGVDATTEGIIFDIIDQLRAAGHAVLLVNHDLGVIERYDRLMFLNGHVIAHGPPADVFTTENVRRAYGSRLITFDAMTATRGSGIGGGAEGGGGAP